VKRCLLLLAALCVSALVACDNGDPAPTPTPQASSLTTSAPSPSATPTPEPTATGPSPQATPTAIPPASACSNQGSILSNPALIKPGSLRGDVDGDGRPDTVRVAVDPAGTAGCRAFVVLRTATLTRAVAPIAQWEPTPVLPAPHLNAIAQIDREAGGEIVVDVAAGASTQFEGVYSHLQASLVPLTLRGGVSPFDGLFAYGGSVGHLDGEACTRGGLVVVSSASAKGTVRYKLVRRFFRPGVTTLRLVRTKHEVVRRTALGRLPEFSGPPFAGCARA
jgi:hypothetical protein